MVDEKKPERCLAYRVLDNGDHQSVCRFFVARGETRCPWHVEPGDEDYEPQESLEETLDRHACNLASVLVPDEGEPDSLWGPSGDWPDAEFARLRDATQELMMRLEVPTWLVKREHQP